ncbi:MAG: YgcG family protein [Betaproteobacteria bacterium]|nr:YgcG family protein [Betaproteobacteria bacterium]
MRSRSGLRALIRLFGILALVFASAAGAADEIAVPPLKARITDLTGTLDSGQLASIEAELRAFEQRKGSQIAVLMLPSTQPETIEQYSLRVAERWKIGRAKVDDGLILIIAKNDQRLRIEVGYGLEGAIPDVVAKRIIREVIAPHLLANDFYGGIREGAQTLMKLIEGEKLPAPARAQGSTSDDYQSLFVILLIVVVVAGGVLKAVFGRLLGAAATGAAAGFVAWAIAGALGAAVIAGVVAFLIALLGGGRGYYPGGFGGGGLGGGGGGFGGGGGGFGGGGASGGWGNN